MDFVCVSVLFVALTFYLCSLDFATVACSLTYQNQENQEQEPANRTRTCPKRSVAIASVSTLNNKNAHFDGCATNLFRFISGTMTTLRMVWLIYLQPTKGPMIPPQQLRDYSHACITVKRFAMTYVSL